MVHDGCFVVQVPSVGIWPPLDGCPLLYSILFTALDLCASLCLSVSFCARALWRDASCVVVAMAAIVVEDVWCVFEV